MGFNGSLLAACIGLFSLRMALHHSNSVDQRLLYMSTAFVAAFALFFPLLSFGLEGGVTLLILTVTILFPYKQFFISILERMTRNGVKKLAQKVKGKYLYNKETGFFTLTRAQNGHKIWIGNVLNQIGSLDKKIRIQSSYYMLAFVVRLNKDPGLNCSILKGWPSPRFHDSEYRSRARLVQGSFSISPKDSQNSSERITGGDSRLLHDCLTPTKNEGNNQYGLFGRILNNNNNMFESIFSGEVYDALIDCASHSPFYEVNITPSSINIYTTLCNYDIQKINMDFLFLLSDAISAINFSSTEGTSEEPCTQDEAA